MISACPGGPAAGSLCQTSAPCSLVNCAARISRLRRNQSTTCRLITRRMGGTKRRKPGRVGNYARRDQEHAAHQHQHAVDQRIGRHATLPQFVLNPLHRPPALPANQDGPQEAVADDQQYRHPPGRHFPQPDQQRQLDQRDDGEQQEQVEQHASMVRGEQSRSNGGRRPRIKIGRLGLRPARRWHRPQPPVSPRRAAADFRYLIYCPCTASPPTAPAAASAAGSSNRTNSTT